MKYFILFSSIFCITLLIQNQSPFTLTNMNSDQLNSAEFDLISHRGAAGLAPENTMSSLDSAIFHNASFIEIDVQRTKDNVLVVMHDRSLDRTTNGKGKIVEKEWDEIKGLDAGSHFSTKFAGEKIPTLANLLERIKTSNAKLIIEVKKPEIYPGIGKDILAVIKETNTFEQTMIISFDIDFILKLRDTYPNVKLGCLYIFPPKPNAKELSKVSHISIHWASSIFFKNRVRKIQTKGVRVWAWTVNSVKRFKKLQRKGFDGVTTDYPNILIKDL